MAERRTKIVATLGPASDPPQGAGSAASRPASTARGSTARTGAARTCGDGRPRPATRRPARGRPVGLLFDLQGPKLRLSSETATRTVHQGDVLSFSGVDGGPDGDGVIVDYSEFATTGHRPLRDRDRRRGARASRSSAWRGRSSRARVSTSGPVSARKGVNVTYARPEPARDHRQGRGRSGAGRGAAAPTSSRCRSCASRGDIEDLRERLTELGSSARTVAKIEKIEAYEHLDEILAVADGVMVARGDYGVEAGVARVPLMQKDTIAPRDPGRQVRDHRHADARVDDPRARADPGRGSRRRQRGDRRHLSGDAVRRDERRRVPGRGGAGDGGDRPGRRGVAGHPRPRARRRQRHAGGRRAATRRSSSPRQVDAEALLVPTATGGGSASLRQVPLRPADHRARRRSRGAQSVHARVGRPPDRRSPRPTRSTSSSSPRCSPGATSPDCRRGARVVLTAGRRTRTPGATSLIMVREIP